MHCSCKKDKSIDIVEQRRLVRILEDMRGEHDRGCPSYHTLGNLIFELSERREQKPVIIVRRPKETPVDDSFGALEHRLQLDLDHFEVHLAKGIRDPECVFCRAGA